MAFRDTSTSFSNALGFKLAVTRCKGYTELSRTTDILVFLMAVGVQLLQMHVGIRNGCVLSKEKEKHCSGAIYKQNSLKVL